MLEVVLSNRFKRDLKRMARRGYNIGLLEKIVNTLAERKNLPVSAHDHALTGNWSGYRECHITSAHKSGGSDSWLHGYDRDLASRYPCFFMPE